MKTKLLVISLFLVLLFNGLKAQNYQTGIGLRFAPFAGVTLKHFIARDQALEGIVGWRWNGFAITGLYEFQKPIREIPDLDWFIGGGGHIGFWDGDKYYWKNEDEDNIFVFGADFIIGLEYTLRDLPISLSLDFKPALNFVGDDHVWYGGGFTARYVF